MYNTESFDYFSKLALFSMDYLLNMKSKRLSFFVLLALVVVCSSQSVRMKLPPNVVVPAIIMFGDSIVDTGNNNNNVKSPARSNFPPYGQDFPTGKPTGRYSNGKVPSDLLVEAFGIKELLPPYANPNLSPEELLTGVCFAVGGVGYDPLTSQLALVPQLFDQLDKFQEYKGKLNAIVGVKRTNFIIANSVAFLVLSSNDIANTYYSTPFRTVHYDPPSYADFLVNNASEFIQRLYSMGTRRIAVIGAPPIGCVPSQRTIGGGLHRDCFTKENDLAILFNSKLAAEIRRLQKPDAKIVYVDIYYPLLDVIQRPDKYNFKYSKKGCCGSGIIEAALLCNSLDKTCDNRSDYVFWDAYHPTETAYRIIIDEIITKYQDQFV